MGIKWDGKNFKEFVEDRSQIIQKIGLPRILLIIIAGIVLVVASVTDKKGNNDVYEDDVYTPGGGDNNINGSYNYSSESAALNAMAEYAVATKGICCSQSMSSISVSSSSPSSDLVEISI